MTIYMNPEQFFFGLSCHAVQRSSQRGMKTKHIANLLKFGRKNYQNGAIYYSIGKKEIAKYKDICPGLKEMNGMHLITSEPYRVCRRVNILRDYPDDKIKIYP